MAFEHGDDVVLKLSPSRFLGFFLNWFFLFTRSEVLEDTFHCRVDIVSTRALRDEIKADVLRDLVAL